MSARFSAILAFILGAPAFCALAAANAAGYRYGVSDLAFYLPAAFKHLDPALFPRDGALLAVQAKLTLTDELLAAMLRIGASAGISEPAVLYIAFIGSLVLLFAAILAIGLAVYRSWWTVVALAAALTLRHAVAQGAVNTLEGYFHPRIVAFALGAAAIAFFLRRRTWVALAVVLLAFAMHPTTALWFAVLIGVAGLASDNEARPWLFVIAVIVIAGAIWSVTKGPLAGRLAPMDAEWLAALSQKQYLFPDEWRVTEWPIIALYVVVIAVAARLRAAGRLLRGPERGLLWGCGVVLVLFLVSIRFTTMRIALAVQLQPARALWILDLLATVYLVWLLAEGAGALSRSRAAIVAGVLIVASTARGAYVLEKTGRSIVRYEPPDTPWQDAMRWGEANTPKDAQWLAHPGHAYLYGTSVRVSARRDVFLEETKDSAIAMYDRGVALRVVDRTRALGDFDALTPESARALATRYDIRYLVTEHPLALPVVYRNTQFTVYELNPQILKSSNPQIN